MAETVTYLDFGTRVHLAKANIGLEINVARCGLRPGEPTDVLPARFKDRPGLFPSEMCKRCLRALEGE